MTKVLILEVDPTFGHLLEDVLRDEGCDSIYVGDDEEFALSKVGEMRPNLIITNGRGRILFLRKVHSIAPPVSIMVITGGDILSVYHLWADVVLQKPVDLPVLIRAIQELLAAKAQSAPV